MTIEEQNKAVFRRLVEIFNERNVELIDDVLADNFIRHPHGWSRDDFKHMLTEIKQRPTLKVTIDAMIAEGDTVATRMTQYEDGQEPRLAIAFTRFVDRKVVEHWFLAEPRKDE